MKLSRETRTRLTMAKVKLIRFGKDVALPALLGLLTSAVIFRATEEKRLTKLEENQNRMAEEQAKMDHRIDYACRVQDGYNHEIARVTNHNAKILWDVQDKVEDLERNHKELFERALEVTEGKDPAA